MWQWIKRGLLAFAVCMVATGLGGLAYVWSLDLDRQPSADPNSKTADLDFMRNAVTPARGRVLAVVTSVERFPDGRKRAGFELTELSRAYYIFEANGYEVDIASPQGGSPPMRLDDDMAETDYAFLNDTKAMARLTASLRTQDVDASRYAAVYFVGGKGTMFDFPGDAAIQNIVKHVYQTGGVIGAVCHGPAALLEVALDDGTPLLRGRRATGFSNAEELFLIEDARTLFPYLLQDRMTERGAHYAEVPMYLDNVVVDGRLVSGQNPWSTWSVAEAMVRVLGHTPVARAPTREELAIQVLATYHEGGIDAARKARAARPQADKRLLLMHALMAGMQWRIGDAWRLQSLAHG